MFGFSKFPSFIHCINEGSLEKQLIGYIYEEIYPIYNRIYIYIHIKETPVGDIYIYIYIYIYREREIDR